MTFLRRHGVAGLALVAVLAPTPAWAQVSPSDRALARSLANEGYDALDHKSYLAAAERFGRADALFHVPSVALGLARAQAGLGQLVVAEETYRRILREGVPQDAPPALVKAVGDARADLAALLPRIAGVTITFAAATGPAGPPGATVTVDGVRVASAALGVRFPIDPGKHLIRAAAPGWHPVEATLTLAEGASEAVTLELLPETTPTRAAVQPPAVPAPNPPAPPGPDSSSGSPRRAIGVALMGAGAAGGVTGAILAAVAHSKYAALNVLCPAHVDCSPTIDTALTAYHTVSAGSTASFLVGGALLGTGIAIYATAPRAPVTPVVGAGYLGLRGVF